MSYTFEKVTKKTWEVTAVYKNYIAFEFMKEYGLKASKCEICGSKFKNGDMIHLAYVKGRLNHFICTSCQEQAEANGVPMNDKKQEAQTLPKFD